MRDNSHVLYKWALDAPNSKGTLLDSRDLSYQTPRPIGPFFSVVNFKSMSLVLPKDMDSEGARVPFFRHKIKEECTYNGETYLHHTGAISFYQTYQRCIQEGQPYQLELKTKQICPRYLESFKLMCHPQESLYVLEDITRFYKICELEKTVGKDSISGDWFVADILLSSNMPEKYPPILVEIQVTHANSRKKENSGYRIITIQLEDESDLSLVRKPMLTVKHPRIHLNGFAPISRKVECERYQCKSTKKYDFYYVRRNGECGLIRDISLSDIDRIMLHPNISPLVTGSYNIQSSNQKSPIIDFEISSDTTNDLSDLQSFLQFVKKRRNIPLRNCHLCPLQNSLENNLQQVSCLVLGKNTQSVEALNCPHYMKTDLTEARRENWPNLVEFEQWVKTGNASSRKRKFCFQLFSILMKEIPFRTIWLHKSDQEKEKILCDITSSPTPI